MKPSEALRAFAALLEEVAHKGYDKYGDEAPITRDQWLTLRDRFQLIVAMNMPRITQGEDDVSI